MACLSPLKAWIPEVIVLRPDGSSYPAPGKGFVFSKGSAFDPDNPIGVPCGKCRQCFIARSRDWAVRAHHEAQCHEENCFITFTFSPEAIADRGHGLLSKEDMDLFLGRLRAQLRRDDDSRVDGLKYLYSGEYGEKNGRAHYHMLLFGFKPDDLEPLTQSNGKTLYRSEFIEKLWPFGSCPIGEVNFKTAGYVARYCLKKTNNDSKCMTIGEDKAFVRHYRGGGCVPELRSMKFQNEFMNSSRRPPIGDRWLEKYYRDVFPMGFVVIDKFKIPAPRRYWDWLELNKPDLYLEARDIKLEWFTEQAKKEKPSELMLRQRQRAHNARTDRLLNGTLREGL